MYNVDTCSVSYTTDHLVLKRITCNFRYIIKFFFTTVFSCVSRDSLYGVKSLVNKTTEVFVLFSLSNIR
jgi:hypothetical protein